jgi:transcriptional regulator GlxA family with amidase domain
LSPTVYFFIPHHVHLLDLAGPLEVFREASSHVHYNIRFVADQPEHTSFSGLGLHDLAGYYQTKTTASDIIIIPGFNFHSLVPDDFQLFFDWLKKCHQKGTTICSICTGAFLLARSGLLDDLECTTHWRFTERLQKEFPKLRVLKDKLYVKSGSLYTSAGVVTGIDLALFLLEERHGKALALKVAKELVVYIRREGNASQQSVFLQHRSHADETVHVIQDWISRNLHLKLSLYALAEMVNTSPRNLTRIFRKQTGITISAYQNAIRVERAKSLIATSQYKMEYIARLCGLRSPKQLRALLAKHVGNQEPESVENQ